MTEPLSDAERLFDNWEKSYTIKIDGKYMYYCHVLSIVGDWILIEERMYIPGNPERTEFPQRWINVRFITYVEKDVYG